MADPEIDINDSPFAASPVAPTQLGEDDAIQFRCHKGIECFNACCRNIDITLTPYDIVRLKKRLDMTSTEFLREYTFPFEFNKNSIGGVKMKPVDGGVECQFMTEEGCSVYEDRPTSCRYYPLGLLSTRRSDENHDRVSYALVREDHCKGHFEDRKLTISEYRAEQGLEEYDDQGHFWRRLILKMKSGGPAIGQISLKSRQLFFMACYDLDRFREFIKSEGFQSTFKLGDSEFRKMCEDDLALMRFSDRLIRQVMFGEESIERYEDALEKHRARRNEGKQIREEMDAGGQD